MNTKEEQTFADYLLTRRHPQRVADSLDALQTYLQHKRIPVMGDRERTILSKFAGWGCLARLFDEKLHEKKPPMWELLARDRLKELLTQDEYADARSTTMNAYPTSPHVIELMWRFIKNIGFEGGRVVDPGCGISNFLTFCPEDLKPLITYIGVEIDPVTFGMAKKLHPTASYHLNSFPTWMFPQGQTSLIIGNRPFDDGTLYSLEKPKLTKLALHARCLLKELELLEPGGFSFAITSTGLMDSPSYRDLRDYISSKAVFLGGLRLPSDTHKDISGTETSSDLLLFQKRTGNGDERHFHDWAELSQTELIGHDGEPLMINEYFRENPRRLVGTSVISKTLFGNSLGLEWESNKPLLGGISHALDVWGDEVLLNLLNIPVEKPQVIIQPAPQEDPIMATSTTSTWQDITIKASDLGGIEIRFGEKPPSYISDHMSKNSPFRFTKSNDDPRWWVKQSPEAIEWATAFGKEYGIEFEIPESQDVEPIETTVRAIEPQVVVQVIEPIEPVVAEVKAVEAVVIELKATPAKKGLFSLFSLDSLIASVEESLNEEAIEAARLKAKAEAYTNWIRKEVSSEREDLAVARAKLRLLPPETRFSFFTFSLVTVFDIASAAMMILFGQTAVQYQIPTKFTLLVLKGEYVAEVEIVAFMEQDVKK